MCVAHPIGRISPRRSRASPAPRIRSYWNPRDRPRDLGITKMLKTTSKMSLPLEARVLRLGVPSMAGLGGISGGPRYCIGARESVIALCLDGPKAHPWRPPQSIDQRCTATAHRVRSFTPLQRVPSVVARPDLACWLAPRIATHAHIPGPMPNAPYLWTGRKPDGCSWPASASRVVGASLCHPCAHTRRHVRCAVYMGSALDRRTQGVSLPLPAAPTETTAHAKGAAMEDRKPPAKPTNAWSKPLPGTTRQQPAGGGDAPEALRGSVTEVSISVG